MEPSRCAVFGWSENYRSFAWHGIEEIRAVGPGRHIGARTKEVWRVKGWKRSELGKIRAEVVEASGRSEKLRLWKINSDRVTQFDRAKGPRSDRNR